MGSSANGKRRANAAQDGRGVPGRRDAVRSLAHWVVDAPLFSRRSIFRSGNSVCCCVAPPIHPRLSGPLRIALGMLIVYGWRLRPGVWWRVSCERLQLVVDSPEHGLVAAHAGRLGIASACDPPVWPAEPVARYIGLPLRLNQPVDWCAVPLAFCCLVVGSTAGVDTAHLSGLLVFRRTSWITGSPGGEGTPSLCSSFCPGAACRSGSKGEPIPSRMLDRPVLMVAVLALLALCPPRSA